MLGLLKRPGVNLRGDLAKLDGDELASRLDEALVAIERLAAKGTGRLLHEWRGPLRGRIFYRLIWRLPDLVEAVITRSIPVLEQDDERALYLAHCEAKDLMDEIRRRLEARRRTKA